METRWNCPLENHERQTHAAGPTRQVESAPPPGEEEPFSWAGPTTIRLARTSQGFGFTLRHFIVYPPESAVNSSLKDEDGGQRGRQRNRLEPMDTIFVKQVKKGGPAHEAGLCTGDRLVKVNGESVIGKTYSQVISLIQNSDAFLELCVMPKDEDILQLAYSQDAYLKGNDAYSGHAHRIPEPPTVCYPRVSARGSAGPMAQAPEQKAGAGVEASRTGAYTDPQPGLGYRIEVPIPPAALQSSKSDGAGLGHGPRPSHLGPAHRTEFHPVGPDPMLTKSRPAVPMSLVGQYPPSRTTDPGMFPSGSAYIGFPPPVSLYTPQSRSSVSSALQHNIDWRTYKTYKEYIEHKRLHAYGSRTIQERLDSLRAASRGPGERPQSAPRVPVARRRSTSHDRAYPGPPGAQPPRSASQDRLGMAEHAAAHTGNWPRSSSQDSFAPGQRADAKVRAHSFDYLEPTDRRGYGRGVVEDRGTQYFESGRPGRQSVSMRVPRPVLRSPAGYPGGSFRQGPPVAPFPKSTEPALPPRADMLAYADRPPRLSDRGGAGPAPLYASKDQRALAGGRLGPMVQQPRARAESVRVPGKETELGARTASCSDSSKVVAPRQPSGSARSNNGTPPPSVPARSPRMLSVEGPRDAVILREKLGPQPLRHPSYLLAVGEPDGDAAGDATCWLPNAERREVHMKRLDEQRANSSSSNLDDSLDAIPFIDEPSSPSADHGSAHILASAVISASSATTAGSQCPLIRRQLSHDQDSLRNAILETQSGSKTERSKSCDEGLDTYREEGRGRSSSKSVPTLKGFRKALDGHKSSEDSGSRRDSSSDIFSDSSKEGWLYFRQLNTDKSKRVGGVIRPWKQMYAVLRGHALCMFKDKREATAQAVSPGDHEQQQAPISVKACLVDISYSDTKRRNVLRLTTSDSEYLLQAEDREDMLAWIRLIQENGSLDEESAGVTSHDLISRKIKEYSTMMSSPGGKTEPSPKVPRQSLSIRHTLLGGKGEPKPPGPHSPKQDSDRKAPHKDESSPPKDRVSWRKGIPSLIRKPFEKKPVAGVTFGVPLDDCPPAQTNKFVPLIVEVCCKLVEERGLEYTGIYRVPGNNAAISSMQEELDNKGLDDIDIQEDKWRDLNVISSLLKSFFRKLPDPLFTNEKYADFIEANRTEDAVERLKALKRLLHELPDHHYETLKFLSAHLKTVSENCEKNKMEPRNLAIVFGPTLVRTSEDNMTRMVTHMPDQYKIVETLIQHYDWFFTDKGEEEPMAVVQQDGAIESQPVPNIDHLLSNIGRTAGSPGEVSDSATSDSAKSKGSWSGKEQYGRELLRTSIFAAASRKHKKAKERAPASSSDDDLEGAASKKEPTGQSVGVARAGGEDRATKVCEQNESLGEVGEKISDLVPKDQSSAILEEEEGVSGPRGVPCSTKPTASISHECTMPLLHESSTSDPLSHCDDTTSDLGTMNSTSSRTSAQQSRRRRRAAQEAGGGTWADVCSITSDYSTTSSATFLTGPEAGLLSPEVRSVAESRADEADDERSEMVSDGRPAETDSESDFPAFNSREGSQERIPPPSYLPAAERHGIASHRVPVARERRKVGSESSLDTEHSDKEAGCPMPAQDAAKRRSTGSLTSSVKSESERQELAWRPKITERLKCRLRSSADDMFGVGSQKTGSPEASKKRGIRRRHTMGGQRDFAELGAVDVWKGRSQEAELSAVDRLKPKCSSQDFSIRDWIARERFRYSGGLASGGDAGGLQGLALERANGDELENGCRARAGLPSDAHLHKVPGSHVVRSRFYQYL